MLASFIHLELEEKSMIESTIRNVSLMIVPFPAQAIMIRRHRLSRRIRVPLLASSVASLVSVSNLLLIS